MSTSTLQLTTPPVVKTAMLIRKPVAEVFQAFVDPAITTRFWFTKSSDRLTAGAQVRWDWEMYQVSTTVRVKALEEDRRLLIAWGDEELTEVEWRFLPGKDGTTLVRITEQGFAGSGDAQVARAIDSMGGFTMVLAAAKALLEHGVELGLVRDAHPPGFDG